MSSSLRQADPHLLNGRNTLGINVDVDLTIIMCKWKNSITVIDEVVFHGSTGPTEIYIMNTLMHHISKQGLFVILWPKIVWMVFS